MRWCWLVSLLILGSSAQAQSWQHDSNLKYRIESTHYPSDSVFRPLFDEQETDQAVSFRHNVHFKKEKWTAELSYQLIGLSSESVSAAALAETPFTVAPVINDDSRLFNLTDTFSNNDKRAVTHRLDRLLIGYQSASNVIKIGRQAVSWGNGLAYNPMDFFNPFDPTVIDTEYKSGDDMVYAQHLFASGNDIQIAWVGRRQRGHTTSDVNSLAMKIHRFIGEHEIDLLVAEHFTDTVIALGGATSLGGAIARGDWVLTDSEQNTSHSLVANLSYSWVAYGKNVSGFIEYFHNGFGVSEDQYTALLSTPNDALNPHRDLATRLLRGELFSLARNYLAGSASIELHPLWLLTPAAFINVDDGSTLLQLVSQHDLQQNLQLVAALRLPFGANGSEFGGPELPLEEPALLATDWSLYAQLAWYF